MDADTLKSFLEFRIRFLQEELDEMKNTDKMEDVTDALIDLCVVAIGTLDALDIDADLAWYRVHRANMAKQVGIKASRPNPLGLPDLIKPEGWVAPSHADNIGLLRKLE
jgi:predicted HAD superfamily Cof-like phosphohydrolase